MDPYTLTDSEQYDLAVSYLALSAQSLLGAVLNLQGFSDSIAGILWYNPTDEQIERYDGAIASLDRSLTLLSEVEECLSQLEEQVDAAASTAQSQPSSTDNDSPPSSKLIGFVSY